MSINEVMEKLEYMAENSRSKHDVLLAAADLIKSQQAERDAAYMDGVKKAIFEIMKEADIPGSDEIRNSGDTDDAMCAQVAERINAMLSASERRDQAAVEAVQHRIDLLEKIEAKSLSDQISKDGALALLDSLLTEISGHQEAGKGLKL